ncbi:MAG TPA: translocation/assembly module TamB domain-containing protein [Candidatus Eisenbacteria bacterium]|nr:translocation/assembly module TamB domain-containing protein [Candidatus Eisenbacteria bacterium]
MSEQEKVGLSRFPWWFWVVMAGLFVLLVAALGWFLHSPAFEEIVRNRVVAELEKATGGTVELQSLRWNVSKLEIEAKGLTIHGLEPATEVPLAHVDGLYVRLRVVSFLKTSIDLQQLTLEQPVVHIIVKPDGSTNLPEPKVKSTGDPLQELFELAIGRAELSNGELLLEQKRIPLDFKANDVSVQMSYERLQRRYEGSLHAGKIDAQFPEMRDIPAIADAEFSLWRNKAQVRSLKLTSQKSSVQLSGTVEDFSRPKVQLSYDGSIDLAQLGEITRQYSLRGGGASFNGSGAFSQDNFSTNGKLAVRGASLQSDGMAIRDASASTEFSLDSEHVLLKKIDARLLGGTVTGNAEIRHYAPALETVSAQVSSEQTGKGRKPSAGNAAKAPTNAARPSVLPVQQGTADFKVSGASLAEVMRLLSTKSLPLDKLNAAGVVNGTVGLTWRESITRAVAEMALDGTVPPQTETHQLPMSGALRGRYDVHSGTLDIAQLNLATPHTEANVSGTLGSRTAELKLAVTTSNLQELQPMLSAMGQSAVPLELNGRASFNGSMSGKLDHPDLSGRVLATDFSYVYTAEEPAAAAPKPSTLSKVESLLHLGQPAAEPQEAPQQKRVHIDSFAGDVQYGRTVLALRDGVIEQGSAHLNVDGSATLDNGSFTDQSPFEVRASIRNGNVADLQRTIGVDYPVTGVLNLTLQASGTRSEPHARGQLSVTGGQAHGHVIKSLTADLVLANHDAQIENLRVEALGGSLTGTAAYNLKTRQLRSDLRGENIDLAQINELQTAPVQEHGTASFTLKTSGTLEQPAIDAHIEVANLALNDEYAGGLVLDAVTRGDKLQLTGRSQIARGSIALDGTVETKGTLQSDLRLQVTGLDIDPLLRADLRAKITGHSSLNGRVDVSGPLREPRKLNGSAQIDAFAVELEKIPIHSDGPIELSLDDGVISIKRLTVAASDTQLSLGGSIDTKGDRLLDLYAKGHLNMALFHALDDEITSYGTTEADVTVKGTVDKPVMNGRVVIAHAGFSLIDLPAALGEVNGTMVFNQNRLEVEHLAGRVGGGQVNFSGYITYASTVAFDLKSNGSDIRFRYGGVSVTADQNLRLSGTLKSATLAGEITITRFAQISSMDVTPSFAGQPAQVGNAASPLNNLRLDVHITSAPELTVQTTLAKLSGDADLRLRGTGARPVLLGRINIAEGDIKLNGTKYHLDRGDITFANPIHIDPILDMEATTRVRDFDITIGLHGTLEKLTTTYRSDPPLSSDDIIALLAFGRTQEESYTAGRTSSLGEGAGALVLGQAINQTVSNRVSKLFGVSSIRINPSVGGPDNNPSARLTIEQQVSKDVTLTYITNLTQSAQQVIQFEYNISSDYTVQAIRDENGVVSFDLLIRKRKK